MTNNKIFFQRKLLLIIKVFSGLPLKSCPRFYVEVTQFMRHYGDTKTTITMLNLFQTEHNHNLSLRQTIIITCDHTITVN